MLDVELEQIESLLALFLRDKLEDVGSGILLHYNGAHIFRKRHCQTGLALTLLEHEVIYLVDLVEHIG